MKKNLTCIVLVIMLLVGAVTDAVLLINRAGAEMDDRRVAAAVFWEATAILLTVMQRKSITSLSNHSQTLSKKKITLSCAESF